MITDFLEVFSRLILLLLGLKTGSESERHQVPEYLDKICTCMNEIAEGIRKNKVDSHKWEELRGYATSLPRAASKVISQQKQTEIIQYLQMITKHPPSNLEDAQRISDFSGKLKSLLNKLKVEPDRSIEPEKPTPPPDDPPHRIRAC